MDNTEDQMIIAKELYNLIAKEGIVDADYAKSILMPLLDNKFAFIERVGPGYIIYSAFKELNSIKCLNELFLYIPPDKRGNARVFLNIIRRFEELGKIHGCKRVRIGANYGTHDEKVSKILIRMGYKIDSVYKEI